MKIIDAHVHFSKIESFINTARTISFVDYSKIGFLKEMEENNIVKAIGMGLTEVENGGFPDYDSENPMMLNLDSLPDELLVCPGINPVRLEKDRTRELDKLEGQLTASNIVGVKIYAGYYPYYVFDRIYDPVYVLCEKYNLSVVVHTGVTYSERGLLKYAHPLTVDEVSVKYRNVNFIIAHMGDPWLMDTVGMLWKTPNVYADLSGLIVSDKSKVEEIRKNEKAISYISELLSFSDRYERLIFGSDWPLVPVKPYVEYIKDLMPEKHHEDIFYNNAVAAFPKLAGMI